MKFLNHLDLNYNELQNAVLHNANTGGAPSSAVAGTIFYNTSLNLPKWHDGSGWRDFGDGHTYFTLTADSGTNQAVDTGNTVDIAGGIGITTAVGATDTVTVTLDAEQTGITSIHATDLIIGEDAQTAIDFGTPDEIDFKVDNEARLTLTASTLYPVTDSQIDLGTASLEFKDAYFDGTVTSDAFAGPLTGNVTGDVTGDLTGTATQVRITDNENTNENNSIIFTSGGDTDGGDMGLESDGDLTYNPYTGTLETAILKGATSVQTPLIEYTDGDNAITIADGGGITAANGITSTAATNTFGATSFNEQNITNVGDLNADSISVDDAATGLNIDFSSGNTATSAITIADNLAEALVITQGGNDYLDICTTDNSETVHIGHGVSGVAITIGHTTSETTIADNLTVTGDLTVSGTTTTVDVEVVSTANGVVFEGSSDDSIETTLKAVNPTSADKTIQLPNLSGYVALLDTATTTTITSTPAELNILDGVTSTAAELNILDGVTSTAAELNILDGVTSTAAELNYNDTGAAVGTVVASKTLTVDANKDVASLRNITLTGELDAGSLDVSGNADIDGTTNLDAVDIDGAVQIDATFTSGVDGQGYDTKFFGDTSGAYILWDTSADKLLTAGGAVVDIVKDKLLIGGTAVTTTAAELNVLDNVSAGTVAASKAVVVDGSKDIASFRNITLTGELDAGSLDVSGDVDIDGTLETDALTINGAAVLAQATADAVGAVELASDAEVLAGSGAGKVVDATQIAEQRMCVATIDTSDSVWGDNLQAEITHNFGTYDVMVEVYDMTSDTQETVMCNVTRAERDGTDDNNKVLIEVSEEHAAGTLRVLITSLKGAATGAVSYATS